MIKQSKKELKKQIRKNNKIYNKAVNKSRGKDYILLAQGLSSWMLKITDDYLKLDVGFIPDILLNFKELKKYCNKILEITKDDIELIPLEYSSEKTKEKLKEYANKEYGKEKEKDYKYTAEELGILERDYLYFQQVDICWEILDKELCKDEKYTAKQTECLKVFRRYCKKLVKFFNQEVISDMKNRGLVV